MREHSKQGRVATEWEVTKGRNRRNPIITTASLGPNLANAGETAEVAAIRELKEETGYSAKVRWLGCLLALAHLPAQTWPGYLTRI